MVKYKLRWKGKEIGEFSKDEIQQGLRYCKFSLLHQIFTGQQWLSLKDFLANQEEVIVEEVTKEKVSAFAFLSAGLSFVNPYLAILPALFILYLAKNNSKRSAVLILVLTLLMTGAGLLFFSFLPEYKL